MWIPDSAHQSSVGIHAFAVVVCRRASDHGGTVWDPGWNPGGTGRGDDRRALPPYLIGGSTAEEEVPVLRAKIAKTLDALGAAIALTTLVVARRPLSAVST